MGFSPREVDRMGWWEFNAALRGWMVANGQRPKGDADIPDERLREMGIVGF